MTKKKELTLDESIDQALVHEEEWPYELPDGWKWVRLDSIGSLVTGSTPSKKKSDYYGGRFPFVKPSDLDQSRHVVSGSEYLTDMGKSVSRIIPQGSTSVCCIGSIGKCGYIDVECTTNQQITSIIPNINSLYIYYFCISDTFINQLNSLASATTISIVNKTKMSGIFFPLAPLPIQQNISLILENQFEKLDRAKELIQNVIDSFEDRKAAILHKAFTGELTRKWREENGVGLDSWEERKLSECGEWNGGGTPTKSKKEFWESGTVMWVSPKDMKSLHITETIDYITEMAVENSSAKFIPRHSILFVVRSGILRRTFPIAICEDDCTINQDMKALSVSKNINPLFLVWILIGQEKKILSECSKSGTTVESISMEKLYEYDVMIPKMNEQVEVLKSIDELMNFENKAMELMDVIDNIDQLKKTILSKAFRGILSK